MAEKPSAEALVAAFEAGADPIRFLIEGFIELEEAAAAAQAGVDSVTPPEPDDGCARQSP